MPASERASSIATVSDSIPASSASWRGSLALHRGPEHPIPPIGPRVCGGLHRGGLAGAGTTDRALHTITAGQPCPHEVGLLDAESSGRHDRVLHDLRIDRPAPDPDARLDRRHDALLALQEFNRGERRLGLSVGDH